MKNTVFILIFHLLAVHIQAQIQAGVFYELRNFKSQLAVSNKGAVENGAQLYQVRQVGEDGQWEFIIQGEYYRIRNKASRMYLANFKQMQHGAVMKQTNQPEDGALWKLIPAGNGNYQFQNKLSRLYLANRQRMEEGAPVCQVENPGEGSHWQLKKVIVGTASANPKIEEALRKIEQAETMRDVVQALEDAHLATEEEGALMKARLGEAKYAGKIGALREKEDALAEEKSRELSKNYLQGLQRQLDIDYERVLRIRNEKAVRMAQEIKAGFATTDRIRQLRPKPQMNINTRPMGEPTPARITRVEPSTLKPGQTVQIYGSAFGNERSRVVIILPEYFSREDRLFHADIRDWTNSLIVIDVPVDIMSMLMGYESRARLWVKLPGGETGPFVDLAIVPNEDLLRPKVVRASEDVVSPGQEITLIGENFTSPGEGNWMNTRTSASLTLELQSLCLLDHQKYEREVNRTQAKYQRQELPRGAEDYLQHQFSFEVLEKSENHIRCKLYGSISGFKAGMVHITVVNNYGLQTSFPIRFEPKMLAVTWERSFRIRNTMPVCWSVLSCLQSAECCLGYIPGPGFTGDSQQEHPERTYYSKHEEVFHSHSSNWYVNERISDLTMQWWEAPEHFLITDIRFDYIQIQNSSGEDIIRLDGASYTFRYKDIQRNRVRYQIVLSAENGSECYGKLIIAGIGPFCHGTLESMGAMGLCDHVSSYCPPSKQMGRWICNQKM